ncbi:KCTD2_5_17 [Mytilus coruscus]|uniref:KCTD2_5_17 n=1 Tax=Mytilus coruscus TaxID=42192 RepID=A0A6J8AGZ4_MYTCO|nr:KCTD2_5_17 [Mytilus coruscus]
MASETEECLCKHGENIKVNWSIWNKKKEQKQCDANCQGLSEDALSQIPSNTELLRLSVNCEKHMLHELALHLGMEEMVWNDLEENYPGNIQIVKFLTLMHLKENDEISFTELDKGLREMEITTHKLCMVRRRKQVKSSIPDDILDCIPSDEILDRLAPLIGKIVFQLGIELGLSVEEIESIKEKFDRDLTAQNKEVLFTWRKDRTVKPTIRVLEQAFVNICKGARCLKEVVKDVDPNTLKAVEIVTDRIRENENRIIQDIQISQILDHMMTHLVISVDDRRRIEQHAGQDDQNKALLDIVIKRREPAYSVFVDGLRNYGYEDIANDLKYYSEEMSPSTTLVSAENEGLSDWNVPLYKVRLQKNYLKIITDIQHDSIVDHLITSDVVSVDDGKKIESGKTPQEKNRNLTDMLLHKNEQGFNEFLKALRKDSIYADLADQIEKTEVTPTDMATLHKCLK